MGIVLLVLGAAWAALSIIGIWYLLALFSLRTHQILGGIALAAAPAVGAMGIGYAVLAYGRRRQEHGLAKMPTRFGLAWQPPRPPREASAPTRVATSDWSRYGRILAVAVGLVIILGLLALVVYGRLVGLPETYGGIGRVQKTTTEGQAIKLAPNLDHVSEVTVLALSAPVLAESPDIVAGPGNEFAVVTVRLCTDNPLAVLGYWDLVLPDGSAHGLMIDQSGITPRVLDPTFIPTGCTRGDIAFEIPVGSTPVQVQYQPANQVYTWKLRAAAPTP